MPKSKLLVEVSSNNHYIALDKTTLNDKKSNVSLIINSSHEGSALFNGAKFLIASFV